MVVIQCAVKDCDSSGSSKHRFPNPCKDPNRFNRWVLLCGNEKLLKIPKQKIYTNCRVCSNHFVGSNFSLNKTLFKNVVPSLKLPGM